MKMNTAAAATTMGWRHCLSVIRASFFRTQHPAPSTWPLALSTKHSALLLRAFIPSDELRLLDDVAFHGRLEIFLVRDLCAGELRVDGVQLEEGPMLAVGRARADVPLLPHPVDPAL